MPKDLSTPSGITVAVPVPIVPSQSRPGLPPEESLELDDDVLGRLEGRSSLGRIGIIVHGTAGLFDPSWRGKATLELSNLGIMPVALYPGMRICSFTFEQLSTPVSVPHPKKAGNKYAGQTQPLASKLTAEVNSNS